MTVFIISCATLLVLVLFVLLRPLLRTPPASQAPLVTLQDLSATVLQDQLQQLNTEWAQGQITQAAYDAAKAELQARALDELSLPTNGTAAGEPHSTLASAASTKPQSKALVLAVGLGVPVITMGLYLWLGSPASLSPETAQEAQAAQEAKMITGMVEKLAARLATNPEDLEGWARLARSYKVLGKTDEAASAYARALPFVQTQPELLIDYAEVLAVQDQNDLNLRALALVEQARKLDPKYPMALVIAGAAAYQRQDFVQAATTWEQLIPLVEPGSDDAKQIATNIQDAKDKAKAALQSGVSVKK
jgi:cytochrome c-type biogenesis protein CcmH